MMFRFRVVLACLLALVAVLPSPGQEVGMVKRKPDPYGSPRPANGATHVPLRTSIYFELELHEAEPGDRILPTSVTLDVQPRGGEVIHLRRPNRQFAEGARGWLRPRS